MDRLDFTVTRLAAVAPMGVPLAWQGRSFPSGPLEVELDGVSSYGSLDYAARRATVDFHVRLRFPEFSELLLSLGAGPALAEPVRATLSSTGAINDDHSFSLSGEASVAPHALLADGETAARVLPGT